MNKSLPLRIVFLSSTTADLAQYRQLAGTVIDNLNLEFNDRFRLKKSSMFAEVQSGERKTAVETSRNWVKEADWFVLIVGWHYGHVPEYSSTVPEDKRYSVTEWEFREATEYTDPSKVCFVFLAGEETDGELEYRAADKSKEKVDLFKSLSSQDHPQKIKDFRSTLRSQPHRLFSSIDHFRDELERTLRERVMMEMAKKPDPIPDPKLGPILELLELQPAVMQCINSVKNLSALKQIHDGLHRIRQQGIKVWRDQVLNLWNSDEPASDKVRSTYFQRVALVNKIVGGINTLLGALGDEWRTSHLASAQYVVTHFDKADSSIDEGRESFEESVQLFAKRVEAAFSDTDWQMKKAAGQLSALHQTT